MAEHNCAQCPIRAKHDANPKSFMGRIWRWHIDFCPGWKGYFASLTEEEKQQLRRRYDLK